MATIHLGPSIQGPTLASDYPVKWNDIWNQ